MKKLKAFGLLVLVLALSLAFIACDSGAGLTGPSGPGNTGGNEEGGNTDGITDSGYKDGSNGGGDPNIPTPPIAGVWSISNDDYLIEISRNLRRSAYQPKSGDAYRIILISDGTVISVGTVTVTTDTSGAITSLEFTSTTNPDNSFTAMVDTDGALTIETITGDNGGTYIIGKLDDSDTWINVTSLSQIDGTWKMSITEIVEYKEDITFKGVGELTFTFNASAGTVSGQQIMTMTFYGEGIDSFWDSIKESFEENYSNGSDGSITITPDDTNHKLTIIQDMSSEPVNLADFTGMQVNQKGTKLKGPIYSEDSEGNVLEIAIIIFTKQ
jgi:hypothetical protein